MLPKPVTHSVTIGKSVLYLLEEKRHIQTNNLGNNALTCAVTLLTKYGSLLLWYNYSMTVFRRYPSSISISLLQKTKQHAMRTVAMQVLESDDSSRCMDMHPICCPAMAESLRALTTPITLTTTWNTLMGHRSTYVQHTCWYSTLLPDYIPFHGSSSVPALKFTRHW